MSNRCAAIAAVASMLLGWAVAGSPGCAAEPIKQPCGCEQSAAKLIEQIQSNQLNQTTLLLEIKKEVKSQRLQPLLPEVRR